MVVTLYSQVRRVAVDLLRKACGKRLLDCGQGKCTFITTRVAMVVANYLLLFYIHSSVLSSFRLARGGKILCPGHQPTAQPFQAIRRE